VKKNTPNSHFGIISSVLVSIIGLLALVATYTTAGVTGAAYEITDTRYYIPHRQLYCPDPLLPVPVFRQEISRIGEINSAFAGCQSVDDPVQQSGSRFRPERNRNKEATSAYADHFTRRGSPHRIKGMLWANY